MCCLSHQGIVNIHPFEFYRGIGASRVHAKSFTKFVPNNRYIILPPTHGLGCNVDTPVLSDTVLVRHFQR